MNLQNVVNPIASLSRSFRSKYSNLVSAKLARIFFVAATTLIRSLPGHVVVAGWGSAIATVSVSSTVSHVAVSGSYRLHVAAAHTAIAIAAAGTTISAAIAISTTVATGSVII